MYSLSLARNFLPRLSVVVLRGHHITFRAKFTIPRTHHSLVGTAVPSSPGRPPTVAPPRHSPHAPPFSSLDDALASHCFASSLSFALSACRLVSTCCGLKILPAVSRAQAISRPDKPCFNLNSSARSKQDVKVGSRAFAVIPASPDAGLS